ncbi:MAG: hypothetical protein RSE96_07125, partial [Niameybacter sp.]
MGKEKQTKKVNEAQNTKQEKKKLGLTTKIFIGLLLGALTGVILHYIVPSGFV